MKSNGFITFSKKTSVHNKKLKEILSFFINGLGGIHEEKLNFIIKYSKGAKDNNFQRKCERLFGALSKRMRYEELILYDEYNNLY